MESFRKTIQYIGFAALALVAFLPSSVDAYFAEKDIKDNVFNTGTLRFSLTAGSVTDNAMLRFDNTSYAQWDVKVLNQGTVDFRYAIRAEGVVGDAELCGSLNFRAYTRAGEYRYQGAVGGEVDRTFYGNADQWNFELYSAASPAGKVCEFDLVFSAWQAEFANPDKGFSHTSKIRVRIATPTVTPMAAQSVVASENVATGEESSASLSAVSESTVGEVTGTLDGAIVATHGGTEVTAPADSTGVPVPDGGGGGTPAATVLSTGSDGGGNVSSSSLDASSEVAISSSAVQSPVSQAPHTTALRALSPGTLTNGLSTTLTWDAEHVEVLTIELLVNGKAVQTIASAVPGEQERFTWTPEGVPSGAYELAFTSVTDQSVASRVAVTIDEGVPNESKVSLSQAVEGETI